MTDWTTADIGEEPVRGFLDALAAGEAVPGGGAAAAVSAALGAALMSMVARFTVGREKYRAVEAEASAILDRAERERTRAIELAREDAQAYGDVRLALRAKKEDAPDNAALLDRAFLRATEVPLETARLAVRLLADCAELLRVGNPNVLSDVGVAAACLHSAVEGAALNVFVNLPSVTDADFAARSRHEIEEAREAARIGLDEALRHLSGSGDR